MYITDEQFHEIFIGELNKIDDLIYQVKLEANKWAKEVAK